MNKYIALIITALLTSANNVYADKKSDLFALISDFNNAISLKDSHKLATYLPPHLLSAMSLRLGKTSAELQQDFEKQISDQLKNNRFVSYFLGTPDFNEKNNYAIIPTIIKDKDKTITTQTLSIFEDNKWYIVFGGVKTVQNSVFGLIYPDYAELKFQADKVDKTNL